MEKKQTALNELLEWVMEFEDKPVKPTLTNMKEKIWQLLPKERQQMLEASISGSMEKSFEEFYQTFKS